MFLQNLTQHIAWNFGANDRPTRNIFQPLAPRRVVGAAENFRTCNSGWIKFLKYCTYGVEFESASAKVLSKRSSEVRTFYDRRFSDKHQNRCLLMNFYDIPVRVMQRRYIFVVPCSVGYNVKFFGPGIAP